MVDVNEISALLGIKEDVRSFLNVRISKQAKRLIFKASTLKGVEVIIPSDCPPGFVKESLIQRRSTIVEQLKMISLERQELKPSTVNLRAISRSWKVVYSYGAKSPNVQVRSNDSTLHLYLAEDAVLEPSHLLQQWLRYKAKGILTTELARIAGELDASYNRVSIRNQKTLWGSCSRQQNINLNQKLLFLSPEIMSYVLYHELTHLNVFDHSPKFWKELNRVYDDPKGAQKALRIQSSTHIPLWATAE